MSAQLPLILRYLACGVLLAVWVYLAWLDPSQRAGLIQFVQGTLLLLVGYHSGGAAVRGSLPASTGGAQ